MTAGIEPARQGRAAAPCRAVDLACRPGGVDPGSGLRTPTRTWIATPELAPRSSDLANHRLAIDRTPPPAPGASDPSPFYSRAGREPGIQRLTGTRKWLTAAIHDRPVAIPAVGRPPKYRAAPALACARQALPRPGVGGQVVALLMAAATAFAPAGRTRRARCRSRRGRRSRRSQMAAATVTS